MNAPHHNAVIETEYGRLIVNRHAGEFDPLAKIGQSGSHHAIINVCTIAYHCGPGALVLDVGACFGAFTIPLAQVLTPLSGTVMAFEPQRWIYHCLCGSVALNDLDNVICNLAAAGPHDGHCTVPGLDYRKPAHFGSLPIKEWATEGSYDYVGQEPKEQLSQRVKMVAIDSLGVRPALMKIDTEGMEVRVLDGAQSTIRQCRPVILVEHLKSGMPAIEGWFANKDYDLHVDGCDYLCIPHEKAGLFPPVERDTSVRND